MIEEPQETPPASGVVPDETAGDTPALPEALPADRAADADAFAALKRERDELYDRLLRATAEFDNYRKRIDRERRETSERVTASVLEDVLPIVDDFERALRTDAGTAAEAYRTGLEIIYKQLQDMLTRRGVTPIPTVGTDFDPHVHQAVAYDESPGHRDGEVVEELRRGYKVGERLLRPAMVRVAKA
jgi:molecular chaperone GrpE